MAGCYHDKQNFKSKLNIEVAREGDILKKGQDLKDIKCDKNPGHRDFIPFRDLTLEHLPIEHSNREMFDKIKKMGRLVVRLVVDKIVNGKQIKTMGSGCVIKFVNEYVIKTNNHVVKTEDDVKHCAVQFHYDYTDKANVLTCRGVELFFTCPYRDITLFKFHPVPDFLHQIDWIDNTRSFIVIMYKNNQIKTENTSPFKQSEPDISFFSYLDLNSSQIDFMFISWHDGSFSYTKSSYFKFQPIPSNRPLFTAIEILFCYRISSIKIEIHIDEDGGNSRVIPGDVLKFGDEFVVKISESIFQDEVKKCRLVWNGEVIGCGTRLHFEQVKSSDILSGVDLEDSEENLWMYDCHPIPRFIDDTLRSAYNSYNYMCCIGHPHGGIKMVTLGRWLTTSVERFDNHYRRITETNPDCQCKEVGVLKYSCKTCKGSSGSPVFDLLHGNLNYSYTHFMGEQLEEFYDEDLIENMNIAWVPTLSNRLKPI